jgi:hypothetical protein
LDVIRATPESDLDAGERAELLMVAAGARRDLGELDAALATLRTPLLEAGSVDAWQERLWVAYADLLAAAGRTDEARRWLARAAEHPAEATDARQRLGLVDDGEDDHAVGGLLDLEEMAERPGFAWREREVDGAAGRSGERPGERRGGAPGSGGSPVSRQRPNDDPRR